MDIDYALSEKDFLASNVSLVKAREILENCGLEDYVYFHTFGGVTLDGCFNSRELDAVVEVLRIFEQEDG